MVKQIQLFLITTVTIYTKAKTCCGLTMVGSSVLHSHSLTPLPHQDGVGGNWKKIIESLRLEKTIKII